MPEKPNRAYPHFGTTIYEDTSPGGSAQAEGRVGAQVARTDRFLRLLGAEPGQPRPDPAGGWSVNSHWGQRGERG